jgi:flagellar hook-associated protein 3 FlgL
MSRVSEASSFHAIKHAVGKTKSKLEDLQIKGSNLKAIQKPSDNPIGNVELLSIRSQNVDSDQYLRNVSYAKTQLVFAENSIEELTDIVSKAKEIAIGQSSNIFDVDVRRAVAEEVSQLKKQALAIGNRRIGNKYIFGGFKNTERPFNEKGQYLGDDNQVKLEVAKDFFVPTGFPGSHVFFEKDSSRLLNSDPMGDGNLIDPTKALDQENSQEDIVINRLPAAEKTENINYEKDIILGQPQPRTSGDVNSFEKDIILDRSSNTLNEKNTELTNDNRSVFEELQSLENALQTGNHEIIQDLLPRLDKSMNKLIQTRTKIGSVMNSIDNSENSIEKTKLANAEYTSKIEDADIAELFTDLSRQQNVLNATYKASAQMMGNSLMDFIR